MNSEAEMMRLGAQLAARLLPGDVLLLRGPLGSGKTTLVRGLLEGLGHQGTVRSPTFNILQPFATTPPVLHVDLYRVPTFKGLGIEDYLETHVLVIEWAEKAVGLMDPNSAWRIGIEFENDGRCVEVQPPKGIGLE